MSEISLQAYENEIDQLVEQARYLEALAHIRHLLTQFPHYVGAYYLLGKTTLEADLPELAVDMFRRALSADPEHLVSRIGLGLAHERRNDLDAALWNLERALETDPSSNEIAEELRRMYGRRDGMELAYVPQTRAGLAHLYLRGQRYERAAEELHALLAEQPARPDLMTALAEAYWRNGQLVQSSEVSQEILDKMPYNLKANLLLGTLWVNSDQEEGWIYLKRAQEIDPENRCAAALFGAGSLLEPQEVTVDRLIYDPDVVDVDQDSTWYKRLETASITVGISEAPPEMTADEVRLVDITAGLESQIEIPDWLRELGAGEEEEEGAGGLGWMADIEFTESAEEAEEEPEGEASLEGVPDLASAFGIEPEGGEAEAVEEIDEEAVPDWLQELAPEELSLASGGVEEAPDWLLELAGEGAPTGEEAPTVAMEQAEEAEPAEVEGAEDEVDWIAQLTSEDEELLREPAPEGPEDEEALPDWLGELQASVDEGVEVGGEDEFADWMTEDLPETATEVSEPIESAEMPDWLRELQAQTEGEGTAEEALAGEAPVEPASADVELPEGEEIPDWLAALEPTTPATVVEEEVYSEEETPDWLRELEPEGAEPSEPSLAEAEAPLPLETPQEEEGILTGEEALAWLENLTAGEEEPEMETFAETETEAWTEPTTEVVTPEPSVAEEEPPAVEAVEAAPGEEVDEVLASDDTLAWLESMAIAEETPEDVAPEPTMPVAEEVEPSPEPMPEAEATQVAPPSEEGELMSGDDALAFLQSLTVGKEEELQALAEEESANRVAEILGRKRETPAEPVEAEAIEAPEETTAVAEEGFEAEETAGVQQEISEAEGWAGGWEEETAEDEKAVAQPSTLSEVISEAEIPEVMESVAQEELVSEVMPEAEAFAGEDALAWLETLSPEEEAELQEQVEAEAPEASVEAESEPEEAFFGWSAFGGEPEEVAASGEAGPAEATLVVEPEEPLEEPVVLEQTSAIEEPAVEPVPEEPEAVWEETVAEPIFEEEPQAVAEETVVETVIEEPQVVVEEAAAEPVVEEPEIVAEETAVATAIEEPQVVAEEAAAEPVVEEPEVVAEETVMEPVPEEPEEVTEGIAAEPAPEPEVEAEEAPEPVLSELDELRAHVKQKRSDHAARLDLARMLWNTGEIQESMQHYTRLIKSGAKSDELTADLERYAEEMPEGPGVLRTLGDAYMKFGDLDKALAIYNRAMNQL